MKYQGCMETSRRTRTTSNTILSMTRWVSRGITPDLDSMFDQITFQRF